MGFYLFDEDDPKRDKILLIMGMQIVLKPL